jgi:hypothetical protein
MSDAGLVPGTTSGGAGVPLHVTVCYRGCKKQLVSGVCAAMLGDASK